MSNISYNFLNSYDSLSLVSVPLCVGNYTGFQTASCFCGQLDKVICFPDFTSLPTQLNFIENWGYLIDFGDGTISTELTATHNYNTPGSYKITLVVSDSATNYYKSINQPTIEAYNIIPDKVYMTCLSSDSIVSSTIGSPILITRLNSYQSYNSLSAVGYSVNISVSGNKSMFYTTSAYENDQYAHLKLFSAVVTGGDIFPVTKIYTTVDKIYGQINPLTNNIELLQTLDSGVDGVNTVFLGTSGIAIMYYYEDYNNG